MNIPYSIPNIQKEDIDLVKEVLDSGWFTMGKKVALFEEKMAEYVGRKHAVAVNNGTTALEVVYRSLGIGKGDEVILPACSYISTATTINLVGATPVFIDIDKYMTLNPDLISNAVTAKTKAVVVVDSTGNPCDYDSLMKVCNEHQIHLILDGAQSLGSTYKDKSCLFYGLISTTSFHAAKILTTVEGGMIFTDEDEIEKKARSIRNQGESSKKYVHQYLGGNFRMTDVSAAFGIRQLERFADTLLKREKKVEFYKKHLPKNSQLIPTRESAFSCHSIFPILVENRESAAMHLKEKGVATRFLYPSTIPEQPIYKLDGNFPISELFCQNCLALPLYAGMGIEEIRYICEKLEEVL
jgi:dTDP-4-amino-4,6-dideoxygalactose transaminase